jgi:hypothetical protein
VSRTILVIAAVLAAAGCGSAKGGGGAASSTATATPNGTGATPSEQSVCPSEQTAGIVAVFGHRRSAASAHALAASAERVGFQGLVVQRRGCDDFAVVLPGLHSVRQSRTFQREASGAGFHVRIECRSHPVEGGLAAVFGHRRTRRAALRLLARAEGVGFHGLRVQEDSCRDWEVDLYGIKTPAQRRELSAEGRRAGFRIVFELG